MRNGLADDGACAGRSARRRAFGWGAASLSLALASPASAQNAVESPVGTSSPIENVFVSAQKRGAAENAQSVPVSLTAFDASELESLHVRDLRDLTTAAPNVMLSDAGTLPSFANFTIRGLGIDSTIPSVEPAVGVFIDGIYQGMSAGVVVGMFDIDDIEILRGPQATLFGHNTTGGAILINTRRPGDNFAIRGRMNVETGLEESGGASIEGLLGKTLRAKIAGYYDNDSGWFTNRFDGRGFGAQRQYLLRPTLLWTPMENVDTTLIYERGAVRGQGAVAQNPAFFHGFTVDLDHPGYNRMDWNAATIESHWRIGSGTITNLFGYRDLNESAADDIDAQPSSRFDAYDVLKQHQYSEELRYSGQLFDRLDLTAGLYYFAQSFSYLERRVLAGGLIDSTMGASVVTANYAAFMEGTYRVTPEIGLIAGGRFTSERKSAAIATFVPSTAGSRCNFAMQSCRYNFPGAAFPGSPGSDRWDNFLPKLGVEWQPNAAFLAYGTWSRGLRSGGYNVRNTSFKFPPGPYGPERQDAFELGVKSDWFDQRLRFNGAMFYDRISGLQRDVNQTDPLVGVVQVTRNTANAIIKGAELDVSGAVTHDLILNANAGYTEGKYDSVLFDIDGSGIGASDLALDIPRLAKWSYSVGGAYTHELEGGMLQLRADFGYRSRAASTDSNSAFLSRIENLTASAAWTFPDGRWTLSVYGRNLLDKVTDGVVTPLPASLGGGAFRTLNEGRVVGIEASFRD